MTQGYASNCETVLWRRGCRRESTDDAAGTKLRAFMRRQRLKGSCSPQEFKEQ